MTHPTKQLGLAASWTLVLAILLATAACSGSNQNNDDQTPVVTVVPTMPPTPSESDRATRAAEESESGFQSRAEHEYKQEALDDLLGSTAAEREARQQYLDSLPSWMIDCDVFASDHEAREFFRRHGGPSRDPYNLDADMDGIPCEWGTGVGT